ncbi:MAG: hypothetical protein M1834_006895 [Cirrosporium novae-zelandiae]|nr:MAG: hypothetical protein M1834_006895 [Cirrosporium novae-zelandiae]
MSLFSSFELNPLMDGKSMHPKHQYVPTEHHISTLDKGHVADTSQIRTSLNRLRFCSEPTKLERQLLWPFPWRFNLPDPLPVHTLSSTEDEEKIINFHQSGLLQLFEIPLYRIRDTPMRSLYHLYDDRCANNFILMGRRWRLSAIPDSEDSDPVRYTLLARMVEALVDAFNWRLELGLGRDKSINEPQSNGAAAADFEKEEAPSWTATVRPLTETLDLHRPQNTIKANLHKAFLKRNIEAPMGYLYTV